MSTRSGKRIHSSFHEENNKPGPELVTSERKTRRKRLLDDENIISHKMRRRSNYVRYPTDDEPISDSTASNETEQPSRHLRKNTLKEHSVNITLQNEVENVEKRVERVTRRTKKMVEDTEAQLDVHHVNEETVNTKPKSKKNTKKIKVDPVTVECKENEGTRLSVKKAKKKKKKGRHSGSVIVEGIPEPDLKINSLNKSITSLDSFHSAAGSPITKNTDDIFKSKKSSASKLQDVSSITDETDTANISFNKSFNKLSRDEQRNKNKKMSVDKTVIDTDLATNTEDISQKLNTTFEINDDVETDSETQIVVNRKQSLNTQKLNATFEKELNRSFGSRLNNTYEKDNDSEILPNSEQLNTTYEKENSIIVNYPISPSLVKLNEGRKSLVRPSTIMKYSRQNRNDMQTQNEEPTQSNSTVKSPQYVSLNLNNLNIKSSERNSVNNTCDIEEKLNTTYDKIEAQTCHSTSSLISSNATDEINRADQTENCHVSITSDESRTENILNITPVIVESSVEESHISINSDKSQTPDNIWKSTQTPLKRESTFTKDEPEVMSFVCFSSNKTPPKSLSLPTAGNTPYHPTSRSSQKERVLLNVTRSIEKDRTSSLMELAPRTTKVMFCSPVNNPVIVKDRKNKVIKSNLKGSNKSFVFDDSMCAVASTSARKRSFTSDAEETCAKRKRLATSDAHRSRTASAAAKLTDRLTPKKPTTPSSVKAEGKPPRTKLPNFAAMHQKQFERMESLNECQERKAKRAKRLLIPAGSLTVLERGSPKETTESPKHVKDDVKKSETPIKPKTAAESRPGYNRFGFKLNLDVNPFSIPSKTDNKTNTTKIDKRAPTLPSLAGTTSARKEALKQAVMREKSFNSLKRVAFKDKTFTALAAKRNVDRLESRTIIKGVRTNRRFELQMRSRNIKL